MRMTVGDIQRVTQGIPQISGEPGDIVNDIVWDSRTVAPSSAYLALVGERVDGHRFVAQAIEAGAALAIVTHEIDEAARAVASAAHATVLLVEDAQEALTHIAEAWRGQLSGVVVGLSGSTGKTTTKNLVRDVLAARGSVVATAGNQNNELGVPKTLLNAQADTDAVVVEMGMRGLGQLESLCAFVKPDWGLITNVGESHIELLGSRDNIARAKMELFEALPDNAGIAFVNASDDYAGFLVDGAGLADRGVKTVFYEGFGKGKTAPVLSRCHGLAALVWADDIVFDEAGRPTFDLCASNVPRADGEGETVSGKVTCSLQLRGAHNVSNACAAAAIGLVSGMTLEQCSSALAASAPERGRQEVLQSTGAGILPAGVTVVDDAYNANPDSMRASLSTFSTLAVDGKRIAVLGDMGELGDFAVEAHKKVGAYAASGNLAALVCVGELARNIAQAALDAGMPDDSVFCESGLDEALSRVRALACPGDAVLVKASHFMEFDQIVKGLVG